jgi:CheY-like chemotaxis protein
MGSPPAKLGVLIVDDVADTRELLAEYFMHAGYHSIMASSGTAALERLAEIRADVIITDLMMPGMGGAALVRGLQADPRLNTIPVIVVTGSGRQKAIDELGDDARFVKAILVKPIRLSDLEHAVNAALAEAG